MSGDGASVRANIRAMWMWGTAFFVGMFGVGLLTRHLQLGSVASMAAMVPPFLTLIPFVRTAEKVQAQRGAFSPATRRYNRRCLIWSFGYVGLLFLAIAGRKALAQQGVDGGVWLWGLAVLPSLPVLYMLWSMGRYLIEEEDEYLRMRVVHSVLVGAGLLLASATVWGFLATFGLVPPAPGWMAVPVWAIGMMLGNLWARWRER